MAMDTGAMAASMQSTFCSQDLWNVSSINRISVSVRQLRGIYAARRVLRVQRTRVCSPIAEKQNVVPEVIAEDVKEIIAEDSKEVVIRENEEEDLAPSAAEIHSLLKEVCDETKIAELEVKVGSFELHMKRSIEKPKAVAPPPAAPAAPASAPKPANAPIAAAPKSPPTKPKTTVSPMMSKASAYEELQHVASESGVVFVNAPKVGLFRQSKMVKGKYGPKLCKEGKVIEEGEVVCYIEQLGTQSPVEADVAGEVVKVLWGDGMPVGYGDPMIAVKAK